MAKTVLRIGADSSPAKSLIAGAVEASGARLATATKKRSSPESWAQVIQRLAGEADLVLVDGASAKSSQHAALLWASGVVESVGTPIIIVASPDWTLPHLDIFTATVLYFDASDQGGFATLLATTLEEGLANPAAIADQAHGRSAARSIFISYSHRDSPYLERLRVHLKPLERRGAVDLWVDTRITAGDLWQTEIEEALARASVAILLVSADFLASEFIQSNELPALLRSAQSKGCRIMPLIVMPCGFARDTNLKRFQAVNDPTRPLVIMDEGEREATYLKLASIVEDKLGAADGLSLADE